MALSFGRSSTLFVNTPRVDIYLLWVHRRLLVCNVCPLFCYVDFIVEMIVIVIIKPLLLLHIVLFTSSKESVWAMYILSSETRGESRMGFRRCCISLYNIIFQHHLRSSKIELQNALRETCINTISIHLCDSFNIQVQGINVAVWFYSFIFSINIFLKSREISILQFSVAYYRLNLCSFSPRRLKKRMLHIPSFNMYKNEILREKDSLLNHGH